MATAQLLPGTIFAGSFRVIEPLKEGGMGALYVAEQLGTGHSRALKVMHPALAQDQRARERFAQEAQIGARIESEHIVQVIAAGIDPTTGTPWLAMELLRGVDLATYIRQRGRLAPGEVLEIFRQLCHALCAAHRAGIVHRDLKLENVFMGESRRSDVAFTVKVLDFGIAKWLQESRAAATSTAAIGSPLWMAPEQLDPRGQIRSATDIWPLGLLAYHLLTGRHYWASVNNEAFSVTSLLSEIAILPIEPPSVRARSIGAEALLPGGFDNWFVRCVSRDANQRFQDAGDALGALTQIMQYQRPNPSFSATVAMQAPPQVPPRVQCGAPYNAPAAPVVQVAPTMWMSAVPPGAYSQAAQGGPVGPYGAPPVFGASTTQPRVYQQGSTGQRPALGGVAPWLVGGIVAFLAVGGVGAGAIWLSSLDPNCTGNQHQSAGHCCTPGAEWAGSQNRCVCVNSGLCGDGTHTVSPPVLDTHTAYPSVPSQPPLVPRAPTPRVPTPTVANPAPVLVPPPAPVHACVGNWSGSISQSDGSYGSVTVSITQPAQGSCGSWTEHWSNSGDNCRYRFTNCEVSGGRIAGPGVNSSGCIARVTASITCSGDRATFREAFRTRSGNVTDTASLRRR